MTALLRPQHPSAASRPDCAGVAKKGGAAIDLVRRSVSDADIPARRRRPPAGPAPRRCAAPTRKNNGGLTRHLVVATVYADQGPTGWAHPSARPGPRVPHRRRTSHITVVRCRPAKDQRSAKCRGPPHRGQQRRQRHQLRRRPRKGRQSARRSAPASSGVKKTYREESARQEGARQGF